MPKFLVEVSDSCTTRYLVDVGDAGNVQDAKDLFYGQPIEKIKQLAEKTEVVHSNWEVSDIRKEDGSALDRCPECDEDDGIIVDDRPGYLLCTDCGNSWKPEPKKEEGEATDA